MGLFSKKKKGAMEIPPPPPVDMLNESDEELPELPPLPEEGEELSPLPEVPAPPEEALSFPEEVPEELPPLPTLPSKPLKIEAPVERHILPKKKPIQPLFISVDDYQFILDGIELIKKKINESNKDMDELEKLKKEEGIILSEWQTKISDIEKKLSYVDKAVVKAGD